MNVGFTGTRKGMTAIQKGVVGAFLKGLAAKSWPIEGHHGDCIGADVEFHDLIRQLGIKGWVVLHPPTDESRRAFCDADEEREPLPYLERNHAIVDECESYLIATPAEMDEQFRGGTWATIRYGRLMGRKLYVVLPDGTIYGRHTPTTRSV